MSTKRGLFARCFVLLVWCFFLLWFIRFEACPELFLKTLPGYKYILKKNPIILDNWMLIEFKSNIIGYTHTWLDSELKNPDETYTLYNQTFLNINMLGEKQAINAHLTITLDEKCVMQNFKANMFSKNYSTQITAKRLKANTYSIIIKGMQTESKFITELPEDAIFYSPSIQLAISELKPADKIYFKTIDPFTFNVANLTVEALNYEEIHTKEKQSPIKSLKLKISYMNTISYAWINEEGKLIKEETPFGWNLISCSAEQAMKIKTDKAIDVIGLTGILVKNHIQSPRSAKKMKVLIEGDIDFQKIPQTARQKILSATKTSCSLFTTMQEAKDFIPISLAEAKNLLLKNTEQTNSPFYDEITKTMFLSEQHPEIINVAQSIIAEETNSLNAAFKLADWVYANLEKEPSPNIPIAADILKIRKGDCNEHATLLTAFANAVGIPAKIITGLVYTTSYGSPAFYYHAWVSVYVGEWLEIDPTFGQRFVDATHISLIEGDLPQQIKLLDFLGKMKIDVLEVE